MAGMPIGKKLPQGDKSAGKRKVPKTGPDDSPKAKIANGSATAPFLPDRDGPAKDKVGGRDAGKPKTSAKGKGMDAKTLKAMKSSLAGVGSF